MLSSEALATLDKAERLYCMKNREDMLCSGIRWSCQILSRGLSSEIMRMWHDARRCRRPGRSPMPVVPHECPEAVARLRQKIC